MIGVSGQRALRSWMEQRTEQGESFKLTVLWPQPDERARKFQSDLSEATRLLPNELVAFYGQISGMVSEKPGEARRGSQEPTPPNQSASTWAKLEAAVEKGAAPLRRVRELLRDIPSAMADDIEHRMETDDLPSFTGARISAQTLHTVVMCELHRGNHEEALENLDALLSLVRLYADEPALVNYMLPIAILGLSADACWDALQAPGWSDAQMARMQHSVDAPRLLEQLPRVVQAERAARLASWESFRSHSYHHWMERHEDLVKGFGVKHPDSTSPVLLRQWREWGFHPLWRFAWADQEELHYLRHSQSELAAVANSVKVGSWQLLKSGLNTIEQSYRPPPGQWRFHRKLPLYDDVFVLVGARQSRDPGCPYPAYRRAWEVTFEILTSHQLLVTAVALRRYALRHAVFPETLDALVPDLMPEVPRDFMDGQSLRYRRKGDGSFLLYSVGADGRDDGGDPLPNPGSPPTPPSPWPGRDWVWLQLPPLAPRPGK